jgi:predicted nucleic acid-binding protein
VLVSSPRLLVELNRALAKPKIRDRVEASAGRDFIEPLLKDAEVIDDPPHPERVIAADQTDDFLVALAKAGSAGGIVAGDRHLLEIAGLEPPAVTPRAFLTILRRHLA